MILKNYIKVQQMFTAVLFVVLSFASVQNASAQPYCDVAQGTAGFASDPACEAAICAADPFCCDTAWDGLCASSALLEPACVGCLQPVTAPANDNACDAEALTIGVPAAINNQFASVETNEVSPGAGTGASSCGSEDGWCSFEIAVQNSVWYTFVGPAEGCVNIESTGFSDLQMAVYTTTDCSDFGSYVEVAANDDGNGVAPALIGLTVTPGQTYYVQIDGYNGSVASGDQILVTPLNCGAPANDNVCDAEALTIGVPATINNQFATVEQFEPNPGPGTVGEAPSCNATDGWCSFELEVDNSVWYSFVAPPSGCVSIEINGPSDLQLAVYAAPNCGNYFKFKDIAANDDGGLGLSPFLDFFGLDPDKTYYIQVDGYNGAISSGDEIVVLDGAGPVPAPWTTGHIGTAVGDFSYVSCGEEYTLSTNQFTTAFKDQGGFILQTLCGDGYIQARLDGIDGSGWAGIVMRESGTAQGSRKVAMKTQLNNLVRRDVRKGTNGFAQSKQYPRPGGWDWLRIERVGNQFAGYISPDGENWQQVFATSFFMNNCLQVGMFVESINVNAVTTATFFNPEIGDCPCISSFPTGYDGAFCGASTGTPGFPDDPACEAAVCAFDPFCCDISWDGICAGEAIDDFPTECAACLSVGPPPATIGFGNLQSDITQPEGTANVERIGDLTVFPNPSDGIVNLKVADFIGKSATVVIYNSIGQEVYNKEYDVIEISTITADLTSPNITSGLYNLSFVSEGQRVTKQVVISK